MSLPYVLPMFLLTPPGLPGHRVMDSPGPGYNGKTPPPGSRGRLPLREERALYKRANLPPFVGAGLPACPGTGLRIRRSLVTTVTATAGQPGTAAPTRGTHPIQTCKPTASRRGRPPGQPGHRPTYSPGSGYNGNRYRRAAGDGCPYERNAPNKTIPLPNHLPRTRRVSGVVLMGCRFIGRCPGGHSGGDRSW